MGQSIPDRESLEVKWRQNKAELNRLHAMSPLGRESCAGRVEELEAEQDRIEFEIGRPDVPAGVAKMVEDTVNSFNPYSGRPRRPSCWRRCRQF